jgi:hypothetical protein
MYVRFEVLTAVNMTMSFFWVVTRVDSADTSVSEKRTVSICSPEVHIDH